jgi:hypothetical protein
VRRVTVINPTALNVLIVGAMMVIFTFLWRMAAAELSERGSKFGDAMAVAL